jgi:hypothetical protein
VNHDATVPLVGHIIRLRISLTDRAGALGQVATIIGIHGGNILSIDVHRTGGESAVDDLVVEFSDEPDLQDLRDDLAMNAATSLVSYQATDAEDPVVANMGRVAAILEAGRGHSADTLAEGIADLCSSPVAWVSSRDEAIRYDAGRAALEGNRAVFRRTSTLPEPFATRLPGEVCLLAVPNSDGSSGVAVVFVARPVTMDFTVTEIARIETLTALYNQIERLLRSGQTPDA